MSVVNIPIRNAAPFPPLSADPNYIAAQRAQALHAAQAPNFETTQQLQAQQHQHAADVSVGAGEVTDDPESQLRQQIVLKMSQVVRRNRLLLRPFFTDFDKLKRGTITWAQFARALATIGFTLTQQNIDVLCRYYALKNNPTHINYDAYIHDIDDLNKLQQDQSHAQFVDSLRMDQEYVQSHTLKQPLQKQTSTAQEEKQAFSMTGHGAFSPLTPEKILHKIQTLCLQKRLVINDDVFIDFDTLRKGFISIPQFRRALDLSGFNQLTQEEIEVLVQPYIIELQKPFALVVDYNKFILDVNAPFVPHEPEKAPNADLPSFSPYRLEVEETAPLQLNEAEHIRILDLLRQFGYLIHSRRILVKPEFQHYDTVHTGIISSRQFHSVLSSLFPSIRLTQHELDLLSQRYRKADKGIAYDMFISEVGKYELEAEEQAKLAHTQQHLNDWQQAKPIQKKQHLTASASSFSSSSSSAPPTLIAGMTINQPNYIPSDAEVLDKLVFLLNKYRLNIDGLFHDFDRLHKGIIPRTQFIRALNIFLLNTGFNSLEINILANIYKSNDNPDMVDHVRFTNDITNVPRF